MSACSFLYRSPKADVFMFHFNIKKQQNKTKKRVKKKKELGHNGPNTTLKRVAQPNGRLNEWTLWEKQ